MVCPKSQVLWFQDRYDPKEGIDLEFKLAYDGPLPASTGGQTRVREKHQIRKRFHPQLRQLWEVHPLLKKLRTANAQVSGASPGTYVNFVEAEANKYSRCGYRFVPLVASELSLSCEMDIVFLRRDAPGRIVSGGGDLDNRIKTLFDALRMPSSCDEMSGAPAEAGENPFYVLLEDDSQITKLNVSADWLLSPPSGNEGVNDVRLLIGIKVNVVAVSYFHGSNVMFLGS